MHTGVHDMNTCPCTPTRSHTHPRECGWEGVGECGWVSGKGVWVHEKVWSACVGEVSV